MRKIYSFEGFNRINEADSALGVKPTDQSKLYDQTLGLILTTILNSYTSLLSFPIKSYDQNIDADLISVKSSPLSDKVEAFSKIMEKVKAASADNKSEGAKEAIDAWVQAGNKAAEALGAIINQYSDQADEQEHINKFVNASIDSYMKEIEDASKENELKKDIAAVRENEDFIFEGIFQGKKGMIEDVSKKITLVMAKLGSFANTPGMGPEIQKLQSEVASIAAQMGELLNKKNKDINKEDIKKADARLTEIPTVLDELAEKMLKQDSTNKEAASILVQAFNLVQLAKNKEKLYISKKEEVERADREAASKETVSYTKEKIKEVNPTVKKFQDLVISKLGGSKQISSLASFKKMGSDGKYGPATKQMVQIVKSGFGLGDTSGETITRDLIRELEKQEILKESRVFRFGEFVNFDLNEAFDVNKAVEVAKTLKPLPSYTPKSPISSGTSKSTSGKVFKEGSVGPEVSAIQNAIKAPVAGADEGKNKKFGPVTKKAVMDWQKANGLNPDGIVGPETLKKLAELKNLGTWTASVISKISGTEVKPLGAEKAEAEAKAKADAAAKPIIDSDIQKDVDTLVDDLDGTVDSDNLNSILAILKKYDGKNALGDDDKTIVGAIPRLSLLYSRDEDGDSLYSDVESVGLKTLDSSAAKTKKNILVLLNTYKGNPDGNI